MTSPNLAITHVAAAQNQKEVTVNDAINALDRALTEALAVDFTAGNVTLTDAQFRSAIAFVAHLSAPRDLTVPQIRRLFAVSNAAGAETLSVKRGTTTIAVAAGAAILLYADGSANGLVALSAPAAGIPEAKTYLLSGAVAAKPAASARVFHHLAGVAFTLPASLTGSAALAKTAATTQADFDIKLAGLSVGTIRWAAAGTVASFIFAVPVAVAAGDEIEITAPATADATLADITWTIKGTA
jgi:hypothetical protein